MTKELQDYITKLPINTYLLSNSDLIIGRTLENGRDYVEINAACIIEEIEIEINTFAKLITPLIPLCLEQNSTLSRAHILVETPAGFPLKQAYCQTLLKTKVQEAEDQSLNVKFNANDRWKAN